MWDLGFVVIIFFNKNTFIYCDLLYGQDMTFLYFYRNWLFSESSLLTLKSSAKKFSTNTKIFSSAGFHVHHHLMLNIYKCWNKKNPVKVLNIMYTIVIQHCWIVKNSAQLQKFSAVLDFMYTLEWLCLSSQSEYIRRDFTINDAEE